MFQPFVGTVRYSWIWKSVQVGKEQSLILLMKLRPYNESKNEKMPKRKLLLSENMLNLFLCF